MKKIFKIQNLAIILTCGLILFRLFSATAESGTAPVTSDSYYDDGFDNYVCLRPWEDQGALSYWNINRHFDSFTELNYTAAHSWSGPSAYLGMFEDTVLSNMQLDTISSIIQGCENNDMKLFLERIRLSYLCYAQRLIYEVGCSNLASNKDINYGFAYLNNMKNAETDTGYGEPRTVQHAIDSIDQPGYLSGSIYENLQHTDLYYFSRGWYDLTNWFIKPVMRIKQTDFSPTDTTSVVTIISINYLGDTILSRTIQVRHFADINNTGYNGNYLSRFNQPITVSGSLTDSSGLNFGRPGAGAGVDSCRVDFRIYWHGLVEVWFDKLIVDDEWADKLFDPSPSINFDRRIRDEAEKLGSSMVFFVDELVSSNAHATKYVKDKLKSYNTDSKLMFALSNNLNHHSHRNDETRSKVLFDIVKPEIVCLDDHVFQVDSAYKIYLPDNCEQYDARIPLDWKKSPETYNSRLQSNAFGSRNELSVPYQGTFVYQLTKIRDDLRQISPATKFFIQPHLHSWTKVVNNTFQEGFGFREPTNQEIQAQGMIAIAHGVESLAWLNYHSDSTDNINYSNPADTFFFNYGLRNSDHTKRTSNIIGQDKWNYVKAMNLKLLHWKPTLDSITWQSGYSVHNESANHEYISDIRSIKRDPAPPHEFILDDGTKYWEMGFFTPDKPNDRSKYFIMVNRRCVPDINQTGDVRNLKIKFDSTQLTGFNNWTITELDSNHTVATFDRRSGSFIDFGIFQPGEGRLYKLAPVMQEGGTLVADEDCGGFEFECRGEVNNDGHDVSIKPQTTILFSNTTARLVMNGGSFYAGSSKDGISFIIVSHNALN